MIPSIILEIKRNTNIIFLFKYIIHCNFFFFLGCKKFFNAHFQYSRAESDIQHQKTRYDLREWFLSGMSDSDRRVGEERNI